MADVEAHARRVDVSDLQVGAFLEAQATGRDGGETHPVARSFEVGQKGSALCDTEDDRERLFAWGSDKGPRGPCLLPGVLIEKLEAAQGDGTGTARVVLDILEIAKVVTKFFLRDAVGRLVVMLRQLADGPDIHLLGPFGQASEWQVFDHPWAPWRHGSTSGA
jgi:hypothetical protein